MSRLRTHGSVSWTVDVDAGRLYTLVGGSIVAWCRQEKRDIVAHYRDCIILTDCVVFNLCL